MYGEDIDYSYRIQKAGYKIYYYPETTIVHFKGESTKKSSIKYHNIFYKAMAIFAKKHYGGKAINPLLWIINIAVFGLAVSSYLNKILKTYFLPIIDVLSFFAVFIVVQKFWANYHFHNPAYYDIKRTGYLFAVFSILWVVSIALNKGYKKNKIVNSIKGLAIGSILILAFYSLLPEQYRFSRAIIILSSLGSILVMISVRFLMKMLLPSIFGKDDNKIRTVIVGMEDNVDRVKRIMDINGISYNFIGALYPENDKTKSLGEDFLGDISSLDSIIDSMSVDEVIFCIGKLKMSDVVEIMRSIGHKTQVKIVPDEESAIIGSSGRNSRGEFYKLDMDLNLAKNSIRLGKYTFDFVISLILLILYPLIFIFNNRLKLRSIFEVLFLKKTWISYIQTDSDIEALPKVKKGIYNLSFKENLSGVSQKDIHNMNLTYAKDFSYSLDIEYLFKHLFKD